ncbi:DUF3800 domain-containing protein [Nonlabens antarcticus]|uniref:DUF3800 domain-containing protein n=1 Tax=Nonlabens antarcticus TaxID=392714 RepID=UPI0018918B21|nr:DUF3800 domain-containing protein [Nonlabens antarcticus]
MEVVNLHVNNDERDDDSQILLDIVIEKKAAETEKKARILLKNVSSNRVETMTDKVAYVLNQSVDSRDSDIELAWNYWNIFESDKFNGHSVTKENLFALTKVRSLSRERARIQNEFKLFQASSDVKKYRGKLEESEKETAIAKKPSGIGNYSVYIDETGKNDEYLAVGSLWITDIGKDDYAKTNQITKWKSDKNIKYEFHFSDLSKNRLEDYKEFFDLFISLFRAHSFKIITVKNSGFSKLELPITDLTFQLVYQGINYEHHTSRAPLPRILQVWIDRDEEGIDRQKLASIQERLAAQNIEGLYPETFEAVNSSDHHQIQIADLFTGAVNRKLNQSGNNHKDELADYILDKVNLNIDDLNIINDKVDNSIIFNL